MGGCFSRFITTNFPQTSLSDFTFLASPISTTDFLRRYTLFALHRLLRLLRLTSGDTFWRFHDFSRCSPYLFLSFLRTKTNFPHSISKNFPPMSHPRHAQIPLVFFKGLWRLSMMHAREISPLSATTFHNFSRCVFTLHTFLSSRHNFRCFTTFSATQLSPRHHFSSYTTFVTA